MFNNNKTKKSGRRWLLAHHLKGSGLSAGCCALIVGVGLTTDAYANPEGGEVARGQAVIESNGRLTNITQLTDMAVINWSTFSIAADEHVNFDQPNANSAALNRVLTSAPSFINGLLTANGNVFIINPAGILISKDAQVDVGGFVATTSGISNDNFMAGNFAFDRPAVGTASVVNRGSITVRDGGLAALVAPGVENSGIISARLGEVVLASGRTFTLDLYGDGLIQIPIDEEFLDEIYAPDGTPLSALVNQTGAINADGGRVFLLASAAARAYDSSINVEGIVEARTAAGHTGEIVLAAGHGIVHVDGVLDVSGSGAGQMGGYVEITGEEVHLGENAGVDASSAAGGGVVLVGGDVQGGGTLQQALHTSIAGGAEINVSATDNGDAGQVVVWATGTTEFEGVIRAEGGANGGDGGFVEVSGKDLLRFLGEVFAGAEHGQGGTLLLDPADITVHPFGQNNIDGSVILGETINSMLRQGMKVELMATNSITIKDAIDARATSEGGAAIAEATLLLDAGNGIKIISGFGVITNKGAIVLKAGTGGVTMEADAYLIVSSGGVRGGEIGALGTADVTITGDGAMDLQQVLSLGRVQITSNKSSVTLNQSLLGFSDGEAGVGALFIIAKGGDATINGSVRATDEVSVTVSSGNIVLAKQTDGVLTNVGIEASSATLVADGAVNLNSGIVTDGGHITIGEEMETGTRPTSIKMGADTVLQAVDVNTPDAGGAINLYASGNVDVQFLVTGTNGAISIDSSGDVTINQGIYGLKDPLDPPGLGLGVGSLAVTSDAGNINLAGVRTLAGGGVSLAAQKGSVVNSCGIFPECGIIAKLGDVEITAGAGGINLQAGGGIEANDSSANNGDVELSTTGPVTLSSAIDAAGNIDIGTDPAAKGAAVASLTMIGVDAKLFAGNNVKVYATGDIAARDIKAGNSITLDAGQNLTIESTIADCSADDNDCTSTGGTISLLADNNIIINADVSTRGGDINVGTAGRRAASIDMGSGSSLQAVNITTPDSGGAINLFSSGDISTEDLVTGTNGAVTIDGVNVDINRAINGLRGTNDSLGLGVGSLNVTASQRINIAGVIAKGDVTLTAGKDTDGIGIQIGDEKSVAVEGKKDVVISSGGNVSMASTGSVEIYESVVTDGGDIILGGNPAGGIPDTLNNPIEPTTVGAVTMSNGTVLQAGSDQKSTGNIAIYSTGNVKVEELITGTGGAIVIHTSGTGDNGIVTLNKPLYGFRDPDESGDFGSAGFGINRLLVQAGNEIIFNGARAVRDENALGNPNDSCNVAGSCDEYGVQLVAPNHILIGGPILTDNNVWVGHTSNSTVTVIGLNHNILADTAGGPVDINFHGDVTLFEGVEVLDLLAELYPDDLSELTDNVDEDLIVEATGLFDTERRPIVCTSDGDDTCAPALTTDADELDKKRKVDGVPVSDFFANLTEDWILVDLTQDGQSIDLGSRFPLFFGQTGSEDGKDGNFDRMEIRVRALRRLFGSLQATVGSNGGNITFFGNLQRETGRAADYFGGLVDDADLLVALPPVDEDTEGGTFTPRAVWPSHINHALVLDAGGGTVGFDRDVGLRDEVSCRACDPPAEGFGWSGAPSKYALEDGNYSTSGTSYDVNGDGKELTIPRPPLGSFRIKVLAGNLDLPDANNDDETPYVIFANEVIFADEASGTPVPQFKFDWAATEKETPASEPLVATSDVPTGGFSGVGASGNGSGGIFTILNPDIVGSDGEDASGSEGFGGSPDQTGGEAASTTEETAREREEGEAASSEDASEAVTCPEGARSLVDVGLTQAHTGSAENIFVACEDDF